MTRPSLRIAGCRAPRCSGGRSSSTLLPSSSMTKSCKRGAGVVALASGLEAVAVAGEHHLAARQRTGPEVVDTLRVPAASVVGDAGVRRELLLRQLHDLARLAHESCRCRRSAARGSVAGLLDVVELRVVDPFAVEGDKRIGDRVVRRRRRALPRVPSGCSSIRSEPGSARSGAKTSAQAESDLSSPLRGART